MWKRSRIAILIGNAIMVIKKNIMSEYCSKLMR
jgi:hypothetical protein